MGVTENNITSSCSIKGGIIKINNEIDFVNTDVKSGVEFLLSAYRHYKLNYPKFYKMDSLCKLAFLCSELLLKTNKVTTNYKPEDIAIVIANSASSLEVDTEHQKTISDKAHYFPSPLLFVYTLPNILIGEIAIRNGIKGENIFFVSENFDDKFIMNYVNSLLNTGKAKCIITGWVNYFKDDSEANLYTVEKS